MRTSVATLLVIFLFSVDQSERRTAASAVERQTKASATTDLPENILVDERLTDIVNEMLPASRTFRAQCRHLGTVRHLRVRISLEGDRGPVRGRRAVCQMTRYEFGRIEADVRLFTVEDAQGLIAHELEHVREFADGISYGVMSVRQPMEVWVSSPGRFETIRAIEAGLQVASETKRHRARQSSTTFAKRAQ
jgi:hypothetical protein